MPFKSKRQQRFMYATKPKGVDLKEWAEKTDFSKLPEKARKKKKKKDKNNADDVKKILAYATEYALKVMASKDKHEYGKCKKCGKRFQLTSSGLIPYHDSDEGNPTCPGSQDGPIK